jgi:hypothetical protein
MIILCRQKQMIELYNTLLKKGRGLKKEKITDIP